MKNSTRCYHKCKQVFIQSIRHSCQILIPTAFSRQIFEKCCNVKFHENPFSGSRIISCRQMDIYDESNSRFSQVFEHAQDPSPLAPPDNSRCQLLSLSCRFGLQENPNLWRGFSTASRPEILRVVKIEANNSFVISWFLLSYSRKFQPLQYLEVSFLHSK
jgi:hypothetical protein